MKNVRLTNLYVVSLVSVFSSLIVVLPLIAETKQPTASSTPHAIVADDEGSDIEFGEEDTEMDDQGESSIEFGDEDTVESDSSQSTTTKKQP